MEATRALDAKATATFEGMWMSAIKHPVTDRTGWAPTPVDDKHELSYVYGLAEMILS